MWQANRLSILEILLSPQSDHRRVASFLNSQNPKVVHVGLLASKGVMADSDPARSRGNGIHVRILAPDRYINSRQLLRRLYAERIDEPQLL
jgi:hypothetical protein